VPLTFTDSGGAHLISQNATYGTLSMSFQLRESVDTGTKRLVLSLDPFAPGTFTGEFRNTSTTATNTYTVTVSSSAFNSTPLESVSVHYDGTASDTLGDGLNVPSHTVTATIGGVNGPTVPSPPVAASPGAFGPYDTTVSSTAAPTSIGFVWTFTLGPGDRLVLPSSCEITALQRLPANRMVTTLSVSLPGIANNGRETVRIFDGGEGDHSPGGASADHRVDVNTIVGNVFSVRGRIREEVNPGSKRLVFEASSDDLVNYPGVARNLSASAAELTVTMTSSAFASLGAECFSSGLLTYRGIARDPSFTPLNIIAHQASTTSPFGLLATANPLSSPGGGPVSFGPFTASASGRASASSVDAQWVLNAGSGDQVEPLDPNHPVVDAFASGPCSIIPLLSPAGWLMLAVALALGAAWILRRPQAGA
jgi:hypothetical protein